MKTIYVVYKQYYDDFEIYGVFSSMEKARQYITQQEKTDDYFDVVDFKLDALVNQDD